MCFHNRIVGCPGSAPLATHQSNEQVCALRTSSCKTLRTFRIDKTRSVIYVLALLFIVLSTTGSDSLFSKNGPSDIEGNDAEPESDSTHTASQESISSLIAVEEIQLRPYQLPPVPDNAIDSETLWLARCIYSETKRPEEQELIAWVVRNRVESRYRGKTTYRRVVLDPFQFSAFNEESSKSNYYRSLTVNHQPEGWKRALTIAYYVRHARPHYRPFSDQTLHFYSEQSMIGRKKPDWARGLTPVQTPNRYQLDERRFRFYEGIS